MVPLLCRSAYQQCFQNTLDTFPKFKQHFSLLKKIKNSFDLIGDSENNTWSKLLLLFT